MPLKGTDAALGAAIQAQIIADTGNPLDADSLKVWTAVAKAIVTHLTTVSLVQVQIPPGSVIVAVSGGSGAAAIGVPNPAPIPLVGQVPDGSGGIK